MHHVSLVSVGILAITVALGAQPGPRAVRAEPLLAHAQAERSSEPRTVLPLERRLSLTLTKVRLEHALREIAIQASLPLFYEPDVVPLDRIVSVNATNASIQDVLRDVLRGTGIVPVWNSGRVALVRSSGERSTIVAGIVAGTVVDANTKQPLRGVLIVMPGVPSVRTSETGTFTIPRVPAGTHRIQARLLGYVTQSRSVTVADEQTVRVDFAMAPSTNTLDQVVVTGTEVATAQRAVPNAMTVITAEQIEQRGITQIDQLFRGDVPGLFVMNEGSNNVDDGSTMYARGGISMPVSANVISSSPLMVYVDGVQVQGSGTINQIDPRSIARMEILTGPQAATIYGSNAMNGVIQIFTKRGASTQRSRPQFTATLLSGLLQNNFRPTLTPRHNWSAQVNGTEGRWSYSAGGSWDYDGPWTPAKQTTYLGGFTGVRVRQGPISADVTFRLRNMLTKTSGATNQAYVAAQEDGEFDVTSADTYGRQAPTTQRRDGTTLGVSLGYTPWSWWQHTVTVGTDAAETSRIIHSPQYRRAGVASDTLRSVSTGRSNRNSLRYVTTAKVPFAAMANATFTAGADQWTSGSNSMNVSTNALTGTLGGSPTISRSTTHNTGAFLQSQISLWEDVFLTYGLRAEWNPYYGDAYGVDFSPRYGIAYTYDFGTLSAKLRGSYGRSTRPPTSNQKIEQYTENATYGRYASQLASPDLGPSFQQGGEGGLELYFAQRGSFVVTRYNQVVEGLIYQVPVDSARSLLPNSAGNYTYIPVRQNLNLGSVRNQGWELQGMVNLGPFNTRGTYSWTKSRVIGIAPAYRTQLTGAQYQPGASFQYFAEHTWAINTAYARGGTRIAVSVNGIGEINNFRNRLQDVINNTRLAVHAPRAALPTNYRSMNPAYVMADLNASQRFTPRIEGVLQMKNVTDFYQSDYQSVYATLGRQTTAGFRVRW